MGALQLLTMAETLPDRNHLLLILTSGAEIESRPLPAGAVLVQLRTVDNKLLDTGKSGLLAQFDASHRMRINDSALANKLRQQIMRTVRVTGVVSYTTDSAKAFTANLVIDEAHITFTVPAGQLMPVPTTTDGPASRATVEVTPASEIASWAALSQPQ